MYSVAWFHVIYSFRRLLIILSRISRTDQHLELGLELGLGLIKVGVKFGFRVKITFTM